MKCPECRSNNRKGVKFCEECGARLELECPACKTKIPPDTKFCGECGQDLQKLPDAQLLIEKENVEKSVKPQLENGGKIYSPVEGERKHVTVLFSDMSGYTAMSERLDPEEVKEKNRSGQRMSF